MASTACIILQLISGYYLLSALYLIKVEVKQDKTTEVDVKALKIHGVAFAIFLASSVIALVMFLLAEFGAPAKQDEWEKMFLVTGTCV